MIAIAAMIVTLSTAVYYLAARAKITEAIWSRYPRWLDYWAVCAACSGAWYGAAAAAGLAYGLDLWMVPHWTNTALGAALGLVWTPVLGAAMVRGWMDLAESGEDVSTTTNLKVVK